MKPTDTSFFDQLTCFAPGMDSMVQALRASSDRRTGLNDFPLDGLSRLARFEQQTPECGAKSLHYYVALAFGCMTTAFIMTQRHAAIRRLETSCNPLAASRWLPAIRSGKHFATVGISHLTTSRRYLNVPPVLLRRDGEGWLLSGSVPWVTGAAHAQHLVVGAVEDPRGDESEDPPRFDREYLLLIDSPAPRIQVGPGMPLVALTSSCTDVVSFDGLSVEKDRILHGPSENVMSASNTGGAGGLQTSALGLGLAAAAIEYLAVESARRETLVEHVVPLQSAWQELYDRLTSDVPPEGNSFRKQANDLALQATHAALAAAKGAGFVEGHPVGRWCREAMFFLVWSCPQPVADAHLCSFSGATLNLQ